MKITSQILSIPPYLSTTWKNIASLHVRAGGNLFTLVVLLQNRVQVEVPGLNKETIDEIFEAHARSAEGDTGIKHPLESPFSFSLPIGSEGGLESIPQFQHHPEQANLPTLPPEILKKIATVVKAFGLEEFSSLSKSEEGCNCMYCQLSRATSQEEPVEEVTQEDLRFRDWEIQQTGDQLYSVTNPLDQNEHYNVYLGSPLGCTCGNKNCEHIRAVLSS